MHVDYPNPLIYLISYATCISFLDLLQELRLLKLKEIKKQRKKEAKHKFKSTKKIKKLQHRSLNDIDDWPDHAFRRISKSFTRRRITSKIKRNKSKNTNGFNVNNITFEKLPVVVLERLPELRMPAAYCNGVTIKSEPSESSS